MNPIRKLSLWFSIALSSIMAPSVRPIPQPRGDGESCTACFFQRRANVPYILRRAIHESGPDENQTFGHCFVCLRCEQPGNDEPIPYCRGWWPADPEGGDYEGDDGIIQADQDEIWHRADCVSVTPKQVLTLRQYIYGYGQTEDYQVINQGGRSCLGYCSDVADVLNVPTVAVWGDYTIPGDLLFPTAQWSTQAKIEELPDAHTNEIWTQQVSEN